MRLLSAAGRVRRADRRLRCCGPVGKITRDLTKEEERRNLIAKGSVERQVYSFSLSWDGVLTVKAGLSWRAPGGRAKGSGGEGAAVA